LTKETKGGKYQSLATLVQAEMCREYDLPVCAAIPLEEAIGILVADTMTAGRGHMGEIFLTCDSDVDGRKELHQRTSLPHCWNQVLNYASALEFHGPPTMAALAGGAAKTAGACADQAGGD